MTSSDELQQPLQPDRVTDWVSFSPGMSWEADTGKHLVLQMRKGCLRSGGHSQVIAFKPGFCLP